MEVREAFYAVFWSAVLAIFLYFFGFGEKAVLFFGLALVGTAFAERIGSTAYVLASSFLSFILAAYFSGGNAFSLFLTAAGFTALPSLLVEARRRIAKHP